MEKLVKAIRDKHLQGALFISEEKPDSNITYFTKIPYLTSAYLFIPLKGKPTLFITTLNKGLTAKGIKIKVAKKPISKIIKSKKLGVDYSSISINTFRKLSKKFHLTDISKEVQEIRVIKSPYEISLIKKAAEIADEAFIKVIAHFKFDTEVEVKAAIEYEMQKLGASPSFPTIVASGKNASMPHHSTSDSKLKKGFCIIDFGANYKGYCSDCTRTIYIGNPSEKEKSVYVFLLRIQNSAVNLVRQGIKCSELDKFVRNSLGKYDKYFTHSLGHGIGVDVHERPSLNKKSKEVLHDEMVITIEPGIYTKNFGIRIEDTIVVGGRVVNKIPKGLMVV